MICWDTASKWYCYFNYLYPLELTVYEKLNEREAENNEGNITKTDELFNKRPVSVNEDADNKVSNNITVHKRERHLKELEALYMAIYKTIAVWL